MSSTSSFTRRRPKPRITKANIARTKAMPTSSTPHHLGQDFVSLTKPATTGNAVEMQNTIAAVTASERLQSARGWVVRGVGLGFAPWLVGSDVIGCPFQGTKARPTLYHSSAFMSLCHCQALLPKGCG